MTKPTLYRRRVTEFKCCRLWIPYPRPGRDTTCPECGSVFQIRTQAAINRER